MMQAALYLRVSTEEQANEGFSIEAQKNKLVNYCQIHDIDIYGIYIDGGISGKSLERPKVQEMIKEIKEKKIDAVCVLKLDRITRSVRDLITLMDLFNKYHIKFISLTEQIDTSSATGRMFIQLLGVFAEWERSVIGERVVIGMEQRAKTGLYSTRRVLGYDYHSDTKSFTINEAEAKIVKLIFNLHNQGKGYTAIAKILNTSGYKTKEGNCFSNHSLCYLVNNGWYYCGKFRYTAKGKEPQILDAVNIPPILTYEEFMKSQKIRNANYSKAKKYGTDEFIFKGRVYCQCGAVLRTVTSGTKTRLNSNYRYYVCRRFKEGRCSSNLGQIAASKLNKWFKEYLESLTSSEVILEAKIDPSIQINLEREKLQVEKELEKELQRKRKIQVMLIDDEIDHNEYQDLFNDFNNRVDELKARIVQIENSINSQEQFRINEETRKIAIKINSSWDKLTTIQKKEFVQAFIKKIVITKDGIESIEFL